MNCIVTGPVIQVVANRLARRKGIPESEFTASNGWLQKFRSRHKLVSRILEGDRADAPIADVETFKRQLREILSLYELRNVMNADEIGLFYKQTGKRSYVVAGGDLAGTKQSKKRITVFVVACMDGSLEQMVVFGTDGGH